MLTEIILPKEIAKGGDVIKNGGIVAFPTETVYGLGVNALDPQAVKKIYIAKGRPSDNPLIVHISTLSQIEPLVKNIPQKAVRLIDRFWPGPLTLIFDKTDIIPTETSGGLDTVAIRMPNSDIARKLIDTAGVPIAAPSANVSGRPSPTQFADVMADMYGKIDMIVKGENCDVGVESTVVDVRGETPYLLRPGGVTREEIEAVVGKIQCSFEVADGSKPISPGTKYKHYSPKADVIIVKGNFNEYVSKITERVGLLVTTNEKYADNFVVKYLGDTKKQWAKNLFTMLREFDRERVTTIYAQDIGEDGILLAVKNRLYKSAGYKCVESGR